MPSLDPPDPSYDVNIDERSPTNRQSWVIRGYADENITNEEFSRIAHIMQGLSTRRPSMCFVRSAYISYVTL